MANRSRRGLNRRHRPLLNVRGRRRRQYNTRSRHHPKRVQMTKHTMFRFVDKVTEYRPATTRRGLTMDSNGPRCRNKRTKRHRRRRMRDQNNSRKERRHWRATNRHNTRNRRQRTTAIHFNRPTQGRTFITRQPRRTHKNMRTKVQNKRRNHRRCRVRSITHVKSTCTIRRRRRQTFTRTNLTPQGRHTRRNS